MKPHAPSLELMTIIRWLVFVWGCLASLVMAYYAVSWVSGSDNPLRNELGIGFGMGMLYGWPAWIGLPLLAYFGRRHLGRNAVLLLLAPIVLALASLALLAATGGQAF